MNYNNEAWLKTELYPKTHTIHMLLHSDADVSTTPQLDKSKHNYKNKYKMHIINTTANYNNTKQT